MFSFPIVDTSRVRPDDVTAWQRYEAEWSRINLASGELIGPLNWGIMAPMLVPLIETGVDLDDDDVPEGVEVTPEIRAWALLFCAQLYFEWCAGQVGQCVGSPARYDTLSEWMLAERYGVFATSSDEHEPLPQELLYADSIQGWLSAGLQHALFGKVVPARDTDDIITDDDFLIDWDEILLNLMDIVGSVSCAEALAQLQTPRLNPDESVEESFGRWTAVRFCATFFPEWMGKCLSAQDETQILVRLQAAIREVSDDDLPYVVRYGLDLGLNLSPATWTSARLIVLNELKQRSTGPAIQSLDEGGWRRNVWLN